MDNSGQKQVEIAAGVGWMALGGTFSVLALQLDRREHLGATFFTAPGFVPFVLGLVLILLGAILAIRALRGKLPAMPELAGSVGGRALLALGLIAIYALGLVGRVPFWAASAAFITIFVVTFADWPQDAGGWLKLVVKATITSAVATTVIVFVFQNIFLVRLP